MFAGNQPITPGLRATLRISVLVHNRGSFRAACATENALVED